MTYSDVGKELIKAINEYFESRDEALEKPQTYKKNNRFANAYQNLYDTFEAIYKKYKKGEIE